MFVFSIFGWFYFLCIFPTFQKGTKIVSEQPLATQGCNFLDEGTNFHPFLFWVRVFILYFQENVTCVGLMQANLPVGLNNKFPLIP